MISLKDSLRELDRKARELDQGRKFARKYLKHWQDSLRAVEEQVFPLFPEAARKAEEDWQQVHGCVQEDAPEDVLDSTPRLVERVLHNYALESRREQRAELESMKSILGVMAEAVGSTRMRTRTYSQSMEGVCETLGQLGETDSLEELRRRLGEEALRVRAGVARMVEESEASLVAMEKDLQSFRTRLAAAEEAACSDPLTGLRNRRELERQLEARISAKTPFCALLFDLDDFKSINDRFGHACGDQALRQFADVLNEQVRPGDVVARWGGDEFFVIFDCAMKDALRRSQELSAILTRRYKLDWNGKSILISIRASSGVVEYSFGETAEMLFRRADEAMYLVKSKRTVAPPD
jgi:diguanylate cyclase